VRQTQDGQLRFSALTESWLANAMRTGAGQLAPRPTRPGIAVGYRGLAQAVLAALRRCPA